MMATPSALPCHFDRAKPFYPLVIHYIMLLQSVKEFSLQGVLNKLTEKFYHPDLFVGKAKIVRRIEYQLNPAITAAIGSISANAQLSDIIHRYAKSSQLPDMESSLLQLSEDMSDIETKLNKLASPLSLRSKTSKDCLEVPLDLIAAELVDNHPYLFSFIMRSAGIMLVLAFETTTAYHDKKPLWKFLWHCRNAVAHNNRLNFRNEDVVNKEEFNNFMINRKKVKSLGAIDLIYPAEWRNIKLDASMHGQPLFQEQQGSSCLLYPGDAVHLLWDIEQAYPNLKAKI
jgi:hypothetical protein